MIIKIVMIDYQDSDDNLKKKRSKNISLAVVKRFEKNYIPKH